MSSANRIAIAVALALGTVARVDAAEQASGDEAQRLDELQRQVQQLQRELERMKAEQDERAVQATPEATQALAPTGAATADPGFKAGPLTVTFGGFAELAAIYRNRKIGRAHV